MKAIKKTGRSTQQTVQHKASKQAASGTILQAYKERKSGTGVIQKVSAIQLGNPYEFNVTASDLGTGTDTNQTTRDAVNSWSTFPTDIDWSYSIYTKANKYVDGDSGSTRNPPPQKSNQRYDAGHSLGRQNGGLGNNVNWVFPQNPQINRGNRFNGNKTYKEWREPENVFHNAVKDYGKGKWKIIVS